MDINTEEAMLNSSLKDLKFKEAPVLTLKWATPGPTPDPTLDQNAVPKDHVPEDDTRYIFK